MATGYFTPTHQPSPLFTYTTQDNTDAERFATTSATDDGGTRMPAMVTEGSQTDGMMMGNDKAAGWTVPEHLKPVFGEAVRPIL